MIHNPSFAAGIVVGGPEPPPRVILGVGPQRGIRVLRGHRGWFVALGGAVLPGHPAGEPFADPQHALEVTNGCPPAFRA